jgi:hypothetical protein
MADGGVLPALDHGVSDRARGAAGDEKIDRRRGDRMAEGAPLEPVGREHALDREEAVEVVEPRRPDRQRQGAVHGNVQVSVRALLPARR